MMLTSIINIDLKSNEVLFKVQNSWEGAGNFDLHPKDLASALPAIHTVKAKRRFQPEQRRKKENNLTSISDHKLNQLFISTHSPYFEFEENFFDVTMDEQGRTHVTRLPVEQRDRYFPDTQVGPETGARLNSLDQVRLYDGVIEDLGLQRGDLVIFTKNKAGHWEIRPEHEIVQELETVFNDEES